ncbi:MAG TPA: RIP metalloprotease RseP [Thermoanaerobacterales bacterium]|nr:RIP metalloprotease RseP [Thermoanaerobacterales bacterium]
MNYVVPIFVLSILVFFHEFGHFIIAKIMQIKVNEFSIGFGPKIVDFEKGETIYTLRLFPLGGFVKMEGEDEKTTDERGFSNKPIWHRLAVVSAGPIMNFILAIFLIWLIAFFAGIASTTIDSVIPSAPADKAGLKQGDQIVSINNNNIREWQQIVDIISRSSGDKLKIDVKRDGRIISYEIIPVIENEQIGEMEVKRAVIGIKPQIIKYRPINSLIFAFKRMVWFTASIIGGIVMMIKGTAAVEITGPIGIIQLVDEAAKYGIFNLLQLASYISINLGLINLLPIPALDGGRIIFILIELIRGKPLDPEKEGLIHFIGFAFLMLLMALIIFKDITKFNLF